MGWLAEGLRAAALEVRSWPRWQREALRVEESTPDLDPEQAHEVAVRDRLADLATAELRRLGLTRLYPYTSYGCLSGDLRLYLTSDTTTREGERCEIPFHWAERAGVLERWVPPAVHRLLRCRLEGRMYWGGPDSIRGR